MAQLTKLVSEVYQRMVERGDAPRLDLTEEQRRKRDTEYRERRAKLKQRKVAAEKARLAGVPISKEQGGPFCLPYIMCLLLFR